MAKLIQALAVILAGMAVGLADRFIKKAAIEDGKLVAALKHPVRLLAYLSYDH